MPMYSAVVRDRQTGGIVLIRDKEYPTKAKFIYDLKANGYAVNPDKVKEVEVFDYIMEHTNCDPMEWKYINRVPEWNESTADWVREGMSRTAKKQMENLQNKIDSRKNGSIS